MKMISGIRFRFLALILLFFCGCNQGVYFVTSPTANFANLKKTYAFLPRIDSSKSTLFENDIMDERINTLIIAELKKRQYVIDTIGPELIVKFHLMVEHKEDIINTPVYSYPGIWYGGGFRYPYYYYPGPIYLGNNVQQIRFREGTLVIDMVERHSGKLLWRGWSAERLDDPAAYMNRLPDIIHRIFLNYPVTAAEEIMDSSYPK